MAEVTIFDKRTSYDKSIQPILKKAVDVAVRNDVPIFTAVAVKNTAKKTEYDYDGNYTGNNFIFLFDDRLERHICVARGFETISPEYSSPFKENGGSDGPLYLKVKDWAELVRIKDEDIKEHKKIPFEPTIYDYTQIFEEHMEPHLKEWLFACTKAGLPAFYCVPYKNQDYKTFYSYNGNISDVITVITNDMFERHFNVAVGYETTPPGTKKPFKDIVQQTLFDWNAGLNGYTEEFTDDE